MPLDLLRRIEDASFPLALHARSDIHNAAMLAAAELVEAVLPPATSDVQGQAAVILRITPLGRTRLNGLKRASDGPQPT